LTVTSTVACSSDMVASMNVAKTMVGSAGEADNQARRSVEPITCALPAWNGGRQDVGSMCRSAAGPMVMS
jgi:hypothetical protein